MTMSRLFTLMSLNLWLLAGSALAQPEQWPGFVADDRPPPRHADGRINFGPPEGSSGYWSRRTQNIVVNPYNNQPVASQLAPIHINDVPLPTPRHGPVAMS